MLSFDLETEGLDHRVNQIAVACIFDPSRGIEQTFNFMDTEDEAVISERVAEFLHHLDEAPALCCFNGVRFDIPFIAFRFNVAPERIRAWVLKTFDIFEIC